MKRSTAIFVLVALAGCGPVVAQVYKCPGPDGKPQYTDKPCGDDPEKNAVKLHVPQAPTDGAYERNAAYLSDTTTRRNIQFQEEACINGELDRIARGSANRIRELQTRVVILERRGARANNNLAGATYLAGIREEMAGLHGAISTERASAAEQETAARDRCRAERERKEAELDRATEARDADPPKE